MNDTNPTPTPPASKSPISLLKFILILASLCLIGGAIIFYGAKVGMQHFGGWKAHSSPPVPAVVVEPSPIPVEEPKEPQGVVLARELVFGSTEAKAGAFEVVVADPLLQSETVLALQEMLTVSSTTSKSDVVSVLGQLGKGAPSAVTALTSLLNDKSLKFQVVKTLGDIGPKAIEAVPALKAISKNKKEKPQMRKAASGALKKISPPINKKKSAKKPSKKKK